MNSSPDELVWDTYCACGDEPAEVWLVMTNGLRRAFSFEEGAEVSIGQNMIRFDQEDLIEELAVDDDKKTSKKMK